MCGRPSAFNPPSINVRVEDDCGNVDEGIIKALIIVVQLLLCELNVGAKVRLKANMVSRLPLYCLCCSTIISERKLLW